MKGQGDVEQQQLHIHFYHLKVAPMRSLSGRMKRFADLTVLTHLRVISSSSNVPMQPAKHLDKRCKIFTLNFRFKNKNVSARAG